MLDAFGQLQEYLAELRTYLMVVAIAAVWAVLALTVLLSVIAWQLHKMVQLAEQRVHRPSVTSAAQTPWRPTPDNPYPPR